ncbi:MAG: alkaline phosphatase family protein [Armatimonadota bacterium]
MGARAERDRPGPGDACPDPGKRRTLKRLAAFGLLASVGPFGLTSCGSRRARPRSGERRLILLGIDGLDARIAERMMSRGELATLLRLREAGGYCRLRSTIPPQSPSAWATLITGRDPGGHGICDFVERDPQNYALVNSIARVGPPRHMLPMGAWRLPLSESSATLARNGRAFWDLLAEAGVPCDVYRVPSNFPPTVGGARQLAGLGVPDLRGTLGSPSYFTDGPAPQSEQVAVQSVRVVDGRARARLIGGHNSLREGMPDLYIDFDVYVDRDSFVGKVAIQGREVLLRQGEWSEWVPVRFVMMPRVKSAAGIVRFYLKETSPHLKLYATPVHLDPASPPLPIDAPRGFAGELAERYGPFHTLGLPEDTIALDADVLTDEEYLHQAGLCLGESRRMWGSSLNEFERGVLFHYFGATDRAQHMFWRTFDPQHPGYNAPGASETRSAVEDCYRLADELAREALEAADELTTVIVLSDHGFAPMYRKVHLNAWLAQNGYLALTTPGDTGQLPENADWGGTTAFGIGLNAIYLNLQGREARGIISPAEREAVLERLASELRELRDPETGERVLAGVYRADQVYRERIPTRTPDLITGYAAGYRCSASSATGRVHDKVIETNTGKWSGDHCIDVGAVPGVVFSNHRIEQGMVGLADVTATALQTFGVRPDDEMIGHPIWRG